MPTLRAHSSVNPAGSVPQAFLAARRVGRGVADVVDVEAIHVLFAIACPDVGVASESRAPDSCRRSMRAKSVRVESMVRMAPMPAIDVGSLLKPGRTSSRLLWLFSMRLSGIDANLLVSLDALLREKSVTRAAKRLGVGQPAVSHSLARLREHFRDPLLVLKGRAYVLTPRAQQLSGVVANASRALADVFEDPPAFVAATSSQRFVVACSDLLGTILVPELLRVMGREAANVEFELRPLLGQSANGILDEDVDLGVGL